VNLTALHIQKKAIMAITITLNDTTAAQATALNKPLSHDPKALQAAISEGGSFAYEAMEQAIASLWMVKKAYECGAKLDVKQIVNSLEATITGLEIGLNQFVCDLETVGIIQYHTHA
jgi:hypothetical protein